MPMADRRELINQKPTLIVQMLRSTRCADRHVRPCETRLGKTVTNESAWSVMGVVMKLLIVGVVTVFMFGQMRAQQSVWQPSPGYTQIPIWPGTVPDTRPMTDRK